MKSNFLILSCLIVLLSFELSHASTSQIPVASQGETIISATIGKMKVQVKIQTHEVQIGKSSDPKPPVYDSESCCTYSRYPCSIVDLIKITIDDRPLFVPRSAFCDLADLNWAEITTGQEGAVLQLSGGDAAESYKVKISFDSTAVRRRTVSSAILPDQPTEETNYFEIVIGD